MSKVSKFVFKKATDDFLGLQPEILEQQAKLKQLRKEQKANIDVIKQYMLEHEVMNLDVGGYEFSREEVQQQRNKKFLDIGKQKGFTVFLNKESSFLNKYNFLSFLKNSVIKYKYSLIIIFILLFTLIFFLNS